MYLSGQRSPTLAASVAVELKHTTWLLLGPADTRHRVLIKYQFIGDGEPLYEQMVPAAMTVALLSVCGDSWFILGAIIVHAPQVCRFTPSLIRLGPDEAVNQLSPTHTPQYIHC